MPERRHRRIQFVSDALVQEIVDGIKTASAQGQVLQSHTRSEPIQSEAVVDLQDLTLDADVRSALASDEDAPGLLVRRRAGSSSFLAGELSCGTMIS